MSPPAAVASRWHLPKSNDLTCILLSGNTAILVLESQCWPVPFYIFQSIINFFFFERKKNLASVVNFLCSVKIRLVVLNNSGSFSQGTRTEIIHCLFLYKFSQCYNISVTSWDVSSFSQAKRPFSEVAPSCKPKNGTFPHYTLSGSLKFNSSCLFFFSS